VHKIKFLIGNLRASFWFIPSLIVAASISLALGLIEVDASAGHDWLARWPRLFGSGAAGARGMLSTIAGSMMTVVGMTFSMTLVTLALASSQYTSRILRNFMSDRATQIVLGTFAGIFTYCLIVLRTVRGGDDSEFIPSLAVSMGVVLALGGVGILIFFVHHIASAIQASNIISSVSEETLEAVDRLFPQKVGNEAAVDDPAPAEQALRGRAWQGVAAHRNGYIQGVDVQAFLDLAREHHTIVRMEQAVGRFVVEGTLLVSVALNEPPLHHPARCTARRLRHQPLPDGVSGCGLRHPANRGHGPPRPFPRDQRHHDRSHLRGLSHRHFGEDCGPHPS